MSKAFVYFVRCGETDMVKIGWTASPVGMRIATLQSGCPYPLRVVATIRCKDTPQARRLEKRAHDVLSTSRVRGEWFRLSPEAFEELSRVPHWIAQDAA